MRSLASFAMQSQVQAIIAISFVVIVSLIVPFLGFVSAAIIALVTLRHGIVEGIKVITGAFLITSALFYLLTQSIIPMTVLVLILWLPVLIFAIVLRYSVSLIVTLETATALALLLLMGLYMSFGDPAVVWQPLLEKVMPPLLANANISEGSQAFHEIIHAIAQYMTGVLVATVLLNAILSLLLARWWQSVLYNPDGFQHEFKQIHYHPKIRWIILIIVVLLGLGGSEQFTIVQDFLLVAVVLFLFQGLAVLHSVPIHPMGLGVVYLLLLFALPHMMVLLAVFGYMDSWLDFRKYGLPK